MTSLGVEGCRIEHQHLHMSEHWDTDRTELQHLQKSEYQDADHTEPQFLALEDRENTSSLGYNEHPQNFGASYNKKIVILYHNLW